MFVMQYINKIIYYNYIELIITYQLNKKIYENNGKK